MKRMLAPFAAAVAVALALYGALAAAERRLPPSTDPWLDAWIAAGLKAEFRAELPEPRKNLLWQDGRELFDVPAFRDTAVRTYLVGQAGVQVIELPNAKILLEQIPEGRNLDHKLKPKGGTVHACREGRYLLLVATQIKGVLLFGNMKTPKRAVEAMFDAFEEAAK